MSVFPCPNCHDEALPADEVPCWKCGSRRVRPSGGARTEATASELDAALADYALHGVTGAVKSGALVTIVEAAREVADLRADLQRARDELATAQTQLADLPALREVANQAAEIAFHLPVRGRLVDRLYVLKREHVDALTEVRGQRDQQRERAERLATALIDTAERVLPDGSPCWCSLSSGEHRGWCVGARAALRTNDERSDEVKEK